MICYECEDVIYDQVVTAKDIIALNKKLMGRHINRFFCSSCLAEYLELELDDIPDMVERFKEQGCKLF